MIANAGAYLFHLALGRILTPVEYGLLGALLSIYIIISAPLSALQHTMAKLTASISDQADQIACLYKSTSQYIDRLGLISFVVYLLASTLVVNYFNLDSYLGVILLSFVFLFVYKLAWNRGVMQGKMDFNDLSLSLVIEGVTKLVMGVLIGYLLLKADYTIASVTISLLAAYLMTAGYVNLNVVSCETKNVKLNITKKTIINESIRMFVGTIGILFFISIDVLMANKYLSGFDAGYYTALSTLGKIIFFAPLSIAMAMFPFASGEKDSSKRLALTKKALLMVVGIVGAAVLVYFLFPGLIFSILFGANYPDPGMMLGLVGTAIGVVGIVQLLVYYLLSQKGWGFAVALLISAISQILIYTYYHDNINMFVTATLVSAVIMLVTTSIAFISQKE